jgi:putative Mg2+ transporter-C (MgtC) family protein
MTWQLNVLAEIALAMALGGAIGFERELAARPAGLRTHMMVAGAAALFVALGDVFLQRLHANRPEGVPADPLRIIEAIITGVSFLGAGTIFRKNDSVEGLTTAASILITAGLGIAVALRQWLLAVALCALIVLVLRGLGSIEGWLAKRRG